MSTWVGAIVTFFTEFICARRFARLSKDQKTLFFLSNNNFNFIDVKRLYTVDSPLYCLYEPFTVHSKGQVGHFHRKDDSCDRTLVIYTLYYVSMIIDQRAVNSPPLYSFTPLPIPTG